MAKKRTPVPEEAAPQKSIDDLFGEDEIEEVTEDSESNGGDDIPKKENASDKKKPKAKKKNQSKSNNHEGLLGSGIPNRAKIAEARAEVIDRLNMLEKTGSMDMYLGPSLDFIEGGGSQCVRVGHFSAGVLSRIKVMLQEFRVLNKQSLSLNTINDAMIEYVLDEIRTKKNKSKFLNDFVISQKLKSL